jgi:MerR family transcriptional regulator, mercuric resistance operon regulatory protein
MNGSKPLAIGSLAKQTGANVETIRYYERIGLLPAPGRSAGGYRLYRTDHAKRLNFVRRARTLGFPIAEVRTLLRLADERKRPCAEVRVVADAHLKDVEAKIADLRAMQRVLKETVARCADGRTGTDCPLIDALYRDGSADRPAAERRSLGSRRRLERGAAHNRTRALPARRKRPLGARF